MTTSNKSLKDTTTNNRLISLFSGSLQPIKKICRSIFCNTFANKTTLIHFNSPSIDTPKRKIVDETAPAIQILEAETSLNENLSLEEKAPKRKINMLSVLKIHKDIAENKLRALTSKNYEIAIKHITPSGLRRPLPMKPRGNMRKQYARLSEHHKKMLSVLRGRARYQNRTRADSVQTQDELPECNESNYGKELCGEESEDFALPAPKTMKKIKLSEVSNIKIQWDPLLVFQHERPLDMEMILMDSVDKGLGLPGDLLFSKDNLLGVPQARTIAQSTTSEEKSFSDFDCQTPFVESPKNMFFASETHSVQSPKAQNEPVKISFNENPSCHNFEMETPTEASTTVEFNLWSSELFPANKSLPDEKFTFSNSLFNITAPKQLPFPLQLPTQTEPLNQSTLLFNISEQSQKETPLKTLAPMPMLFKTISTESTSRTLKPLNQDQFSGCYWKPLGLGFEPEKPASQEEPSSLMLNREDSNTDLFFKNKRKNNPWITKQKSLMPGLFGPSYRSRSLFSRDTTDSITDNTDGQSETCHSTYSMDFEKLPSFEKVAEKPMESSVAIPLPLNEEHANSISNELNNSQGCQFAQSLFGF